jgi:hypothetical protein
VAQAHRFRLDAFAFGSVLPAQAAAGAAEPAAATEATTDSSLSLASTDLAFAALAYEQATTGGTSAAKKRLI